MRVLVISSNFYEGNGDVIRTALESCEAGRRGVAIDWYHTTKAAQDASPSDYDLLIIRPEDKDKDYLRAWGQAGVPMVFLYGGVSLQDEAVPQRAGMGKAAAEVLSDKFYHAMALNLRGLHNRDKVGTLSDKVQSRHDARIVRISQGAVNAGASLMTPPRPTVASIGSAEIVDLNGRRTGAKVIILADRRPAP